ncbi:MAG: LacI family DNA-binding transcriptional regulator [Victivallales bacterium]|nr:LacI family DNA-binding transcriptional regulator [Victivallales bacterium]
MSDIAREAGCSVAVVSRVLNPGDGLPPRIAKATRTRVRETARRLGYRPNRNAEFLKRGQLPEIGVFAERHSNNLVLELVRGTSAAAEREGFYISFRYSIDGESFHDFLEMALHRRLCGIITYPHYELQPRTMPLLLRFQAEGGAVVVLDVGNYGRIQPVFPCVAIDDLEGGRLVARLLMERGARRFLYAGPSRLRQEGFCEELAANHCDIPLAVKTDDALDALHRDALTGVFCGNDRIAITLHNNMLAGGLCPGRDALLVGYDNLYGTEALAPPLTTVYQPFAEAGEKAVDMMISLLYAKQASNVVLSPSLVRRGTA